MVLFCNRCGGQIDEADSFCDRCGNHIQKQTSVTFSDSVGKTCPFCQYPIKPGENIVVCPECHVPHHVACWTENGGQCTTFGCKGRLLSSSKTVDVNLNRQSNPIVMQSPQSNNLSTSKTPWKGICIAVSAVLVIVLVGFFIQNSSQVTNRSTNQITPPSTGENTKIPPIPSANPIVAKQLSSQEKAVKAVNDMYQLISQKQYRQAYDCFSNQWKSAITYDGWVQGYKNTLSNQVLGTEVISGGRDGDQFATVKFRLQARDREGGRILVQIFEGQWQLVLQDNRWLLDDASVKKVSSYYE